MSHLVIFLILFKYVKYEHVDVKDLLHPMHLDELNQISTLKVKIHFTGQNQKIQKKLNRFIVSWLMASQVIYHHNANVHINVSLRLYDVTARVMVTLTKEPCPFARAKRQGS